MSISSYILSVVAAFIVLSLSNHINRVCKKKLRITFKAIRNCLRFIILLFLVKFNAVAQQKEFVFKNFTQEEGLPSNEVYYVFEDSRHYIWIATDLGVVRYNGNKFEQFNLPDNVVFKIKEDAKGRVWFFNHSARLAYFENEKIVAYRYNDSISKYIPFINTVNAYIDSAENIYLNSSAGYNFMITKNGTVSSLGYSNYMHDQFVVSIFEGEKYASFPRRLSKTGWGSDTMEITVKEPNHNRRYLVPASTPTTYAHYGTIGIKDGPLYFYAGKSLIKLNTDGSFATTKANNTIYDIKNYNGFILVATQRGGVELFDENLKRLTNISILPDKSVSSIQIDFEGGLWLTTLENGVYYAKNMNVFHAIGFDVFNKPISHAFNYKDSALFFSSSKGIYYLDNTSFRQVIEMPNSITSSIQDISNDRLLISGDFPNISSSIFHIEKIKNPYYREFVFTTSEREVVKLPNDSLLIGRLSSFFLYRTNKYERNATFLKKINWKYARIFLDRQKQIWLGSLDGIYTLNKTFDSIIQYHHPSNVLKKGVSCLRQMDNGILAAGIRSDGIVLMRNKSILKHITEEDGLLNNKIRYILPVKDRLWVATAKGISVIRFTSYQPLQFTITNIGKNEGFYNITINQLLLYRNYIVAATSNGFYFIEDPEELLTTRLPEIPFFINKVSTSAGDTNGIKNISLPYSQKRLVLKYSAVSFNSYDAITYLYRFDHGDTIWHSTTNTELPLENLEPGTYKVEIKAAILNQQRTSGIQNFTVTVEKPWWQNNWFRLLVLVAIAAGLYLYVSNRVRKIGTDEKRKADLNTKLAELEQTALRSQMNPHFIFNCLTSIQQLIISGNKTDANEYLVKFARLIRKTLELSAQPYISIQEETAYLDEYLFLEQLRLSGRFEYSFTHNDAMDLNNIYIPNMMIQPVVENCIRHGIKALVNKKGIINIDFRNVGETIICTVTDNGVGRTESALSNVAEFTKHKSFGVNIVQKRLSGLAETGQSVTGIQIKDLIDENGTAEGTQVILQLPYKKII